MLSRRVMHRRRDQVRRPFAGQLDDELAEIGLRDLDARRLERRVEMDLLGGHRFRFDRPLAVRFLRDVDDDAACFLGVAGPVDLAAEVDDGRFELFEIAVEMGERVLLDALGVIAQRWSCRPGPRSRGDCRPSACRSGGRARSVARHRPGPAARRRGNRGARGVRSRQQSLRRVCPSLVEKSTGEPAARAKGEPAGRFGSPLARAAGSPVNASCPLR